MSQNYPNWATGKHGGLIVIASIAIVAVLIISFGLLYVTESARVSALNSSVGSQQTVINGGQSTITQLSQALSSLQSQASTLQSSLQGQISTLQGNVSSYQNLVSALKSVVSADQAKINSLQGELSTDNSTISSLNSQIAAANQMIDNLTSNLNLGFTSSLLNDQAATITGNATAVSPFLTFSPAHAGYLLVQVSNANEAYLVESSQTPTPSNAQGAIFESVTGLNATSPGVSYFVIPVVPGTGDSFALVSNYATSGTAVVSATYFY